MSDLNSFINSLPIDRLAQQFGVSGDDIRKAVESIAPALVGGMQANAQDPNGAASLETALKDHAGNADSLLADPDPSKIDTTDGSAIAAHIFGQNQGAVVDKVSQQSSTDKSLVEKLLPVLAPLVMAWLASRMFSHKDKPKAAPQDAGTAAAPQAPNHAPTDVQGTQTSTTPGSASSTDLQDMLGGVLGGGSGQQGGGGLGDLLGSLGGLLGGGRR